MKNITVTDVIANVRKKYGQESVVDLENFHTSCQPIPTGIFVFDHITGIGGLPIGRIVELYGPESSGKTTVLLHACAQCQKAGKAVLYLDYENAFDKGYAQRIGVNTSKELFILAQPMTLEEGVNIMEPFLETNTVGLIVVDCVAAMMAQADLQDSKGKEREFGDKKPRAAKAVAMAESLTRLTKRVKASDCCLCYINQIRIDLKAAERGITKWRTPSSDSLKFYASMRVEFKKTGGITGKLFNPTTGDFEAGTIGIITEANIKKNKVGVPFKHCEFVMLEGRGVDRAATVVNMALKRGYIEQRGGWYILPTVDGIECPSKQGLSVVIDYYRENVQVLDALEYILIKEIQKSDGIPETGPLEVSEDLTTDQDPLSESLENTVDESLEEKDSVVEEVEENSVEQFDVNELLGDDDAN